MTFILALLFVLAVMLFWLITLLGFPGNWLIVLATVLYVWLMPDHGSSTTRWWAVGIVTCLAFLGEIAELSTSSASVKKAGGSRRGAFFSLLGSIIGSIGGLFIGIPIPIIGSVLAAVLFAGLGALIGAMVGETTKGQTFQDSWKIGRAAFKGRLFGTAAKAIIGAMMAGLAIAMTFT
jgi:uncharacterized protein YqgC (DUF456 family)